MASVDVLIQTHNEELNLPRALESLRGWANKVFVLDSGSTDRTVEIAREFGAVVVVHAWEGYARQKNWALDNLPWESPWILIVDADESITVPLRDEIGRLVGRPPGEVREAAFWINRVLIFMGRKIWHCGYFPSWNLRLFKRDRARYEDRSVHEHMRVAGPTGYLRNLIQHEDLRGLEHFLAKHNRYSTLEAREIYIANVKWPGLDKFLGDRVSRMRFIKGRVIPTLPLPWLWRLIYMWVFCRGFLDGRAGWVLCNLVSAYELFIQAKYFELRRLKQVKLDPVVGLSLQEGAMDAKMGTDLAALTRQSSPAASLSSPAVLSERAALAMPSVDPGMPQPSTARPRRGTVPVSVIIPTLNEARNLPRCLDHLQWADEVVIVDSQSRDETCQIARAYGARVVNFHWDGQWPKKKNWALHNVDFRNKWVLIVDADEWIVPELADEIARAIRSTDKVGFYVNRRFIFMGHWIKHCGYYPSWNLRLIKRGFGKYEQLTNVGDTGSGDNEVHEHVVANGDVGYLHADMLHFAFPSIDVFMEKHNRYSNWEAIVQFKTVEGGAAGVTDNRDLSRRRRLKAFSRRLPFRSTLRFFYAYVLQGGFLDGRAGYVFCHLLAIYEYLSVAKYKELRQSEDDQRMARSLSSVPEVNWRAAEAAETVRSN